MDSQCITSFLTPSLTCNPNLHTEIQTSIYRTKQNKNEEQLQMERLEPKTSSNLSFDTMLSLQLSPQLKLVENGPNNVYKAFQPLDSQFPSNVHFN